MLTPLIDKQTFKHITIQQTRTYFYKTLNTHITKTVLFFSKTGQPLTTGPGTIGWNTVTENKISYSWDITRVMFCR